MKAYIVMNGYESVVALATFSKSQAEAYADTNTYYDYVQEIDIEGMPDIEELRAAGHDCWDW